MTSDPAGHRRPHTLPHTGPRARRTSSNLVAVALLAVVGPLVAACGGDGPDAGASQPPTTSSTADDAAVEPDDPVVQLVTHDSFAVSDEVWTAFTAESGYEVQVLRSGDAGTTVNAAVLTAGNPQGDVLFGVDTTLLSRALAADVFVPHEPTGADTLDPSLTGPVEDDWLVTPIDRGDVCLNYDVAAYADLGLDPPQELADLTDEAYAGQLVVQNPATSSPGLAFLLATVATFGDDGWEDFWRDLVANDVVVSGGWEDAYYGVFSGAAGSEGDRPLVVSYASSPPAEVLFSEEELDAAPTGVVTASCFQQVEYAGVLAGTDNEAGARALVDFMTSPTFQSDIPLQMFVFPARDDVDLPAEFVEYTSVPDDPIRFDPDRLEEQRDDLVRRWTEIVLG